MICGALFVLIPWLNSEFSDVSDFSSWNELFHAKINENIFAKILDTFYRTNNVIKAIQLYLLMYKTCDLGRLLPIFLEGCYSGCFISLRLALVTFFCSLLNNHVNIGIFRILVPDKK